MRSLLLVAAVAAGACTRAADACVVPDSVPTISDGGPGCSVTRTIGACHVHDDGSQTCTYNCTSEEYGLGCYGFAADEALHCREFGFANPIGTHFYCCPCAR